MGLESIEGSSFLCIPSYLCSTVLDTNVRSIAGAMERGDYLFVIEKTGYF
jgi:hypothetical protein